MGASSGEGGKGTASPRRGRWSQSEIARLEELYGLRDDVAIARELNRPVASVRRMAEQVFAGPVHDGPWTASEVLRLKRGLGATSAEVLARSLRRNVEDVQRQILDLGRIQRSGRWSREEVAQLKRIYGTRTDDDLARIFGRSVESIRSQASRLALAKDKAFLRKVNKESVTRMPRWTEDELDVLREMYPSHANLDIAKRLDRSVKSVVSKAHNLGLRKDAKRLREMGRENVSLRYREREKERA